MTELAAADGKIECAIDEASALENGLDRGGASGCHRVGQENLSMPRKLARNGVKARHRDYRVADAADAENNQICGSTLYHDDYTWTGQDRLPP
jgi:hypothetical protein